MVSRRVVSGWWSTTNNQLPTTNYQLPTTNYQQSTTNYQQNTKKPGVLVHSQVFYLLINNKSVVF
ncbi:MAG: hypothetical protein ACHBN1_03390 [Heteroscytonema crispum UTEX LB 1556]